ncbi:DUF2177 family protein [Primorskyibacter sedentarius]|uniref:Putative membrane protein n=1 Tax=Primorskyibacter sedentarius TaxID=745311 RepID=A0A4R3JP99_9RHOB|nr:DUF2177 family protein [Primorskyibacter sedentarius]TCS67422.1 putative membrane protein [Primorskyibacter sedentarius]
MHLIILYVSTAVVFLGLDAVMLKTVMRPLFERHIGNTLSETLNLGAAAGFYLFYVAGLIYFVSLPALRADAPPQAFFTGALLGAMAYGTYEFTNFATLKGWHWHMVATDLAWGTVLTGVSALAGVLITRALS